MSEPLVGLNTPPEGYGEWLTDLKGRIHAAQQRAVLAANHELGFPAYAVDTRERETERPLVKHVADFLLALRAGFAFAGQQVRLDVGGDEIRIDLLFYHLKLRCYVVVELKAGDFKPKHFDQLSFNLTAVDGQLQYPQDAPTIGLLLRKSKNKVVAKYALRNNVRAIGVAGYQLVESLPEELQSSLPSIEQIERELA